MDRTDEDRAELAARIWQASQAGRYCEVSPEEMWWLRREFSDDPLGEAKYNDWLVRSPAFVPEAMTVPRPPVRLVVRYSS